MTGRIALVTGAARGLGLAVAQHLAREGDTVILCDVDADDAEREAAQLQGDGLQAQAIEMDVSDAAAVASAFARLAKLVGRLDILVNSAGIQGLLDGQRPSVAQMPLELWRRTLDVNLTGSFLTCQAAIPLMRANRWGRIVNIASRAARMRTSNGNSNYAASKAGLIAFSRVLAGELGAAGITVNCVAPSRIDTDMTLAAQDSRSLVAASIAQTVVGRLCQPVDVVAGIAFLCSEQASFVTGSVLDINGGSFMA